MVFHTYNQFILYTSNLIYWDVDPKSHYNKKNMWFRTKKSYNGNGFAQIAIQCWGH